jgi:CubicO group peptidase (beta-lactamase class C family)
MELYPFMRLRDAGIPAMMVAHLSVPSLDATANLPSTLSPKIVQGILRDEMHYEGLIFTDAMNMKGVLKYYPVGDAELRAFKAGVDVLLMSTDVAKAVSTIKNALTSGEITKAQLEEKVRRILQSKYRLGLKSAPYASPYNLWEDLNGESAKFLKKKLYEAAVTLAKNDNNFVPLRNLEAMNIAYLQIGGSSGNTFERTLQKYANVRPYYLKSSFTAADMSAALASLKSYNTVIIGVFGLSKKISDNFGINANTASLSRALTQQGKNTVLSIFGSPYALKNFGTETAVLMGYEEDADAQQAVASAIFGGLVVDGKLPVTASPQFKEGQGFVIPEIIRFGLSLPEEQGMKSASLNKIDSIVNSYIRMRAIPGAAVAVMKGKHIVYEKGFGKMDYGVASDSIDPLNAMYDIASMTKITATIASSMRLYEQGILNLDATVGEYIPEFQGTNKSSITVRELMQHTSGLKAWIPFYKETFADKSQTLLRKDIYSNTYSTDYNIEVAPQLYMNQQYLETMWNEIKYSEMGTRGRMVYSDLSMIILARIIQNITGSNIEDYACDNFYSSMGMNSTMFNPGKKGYSYRCVPTEVDDNWRHCVVQGYVHDYASAMFGGVAGHAGLFSNVYDLCKMYGMVKNGGTYGGRYYFSPETVNYFKRKQIAGSRRGLGWDKPNSDPDKPDPASPKASDDTYGHTGFTGTCVWVDPKYDIVFIFLANRTYPDQNNKLFNKRAVRKIVMDKVYESMGIK